LAEISLREALTRRRTVRQFTQATVSRTALARLIQAAQGETGAEGRRTAPSAHALFPLRLFVVAGRVDDLETGLHAVAPASLEMTKLHGKDLRPELRAAAIGDPAWITDAACIVAIAADMIGPGRHFADQPPYGARGARYVHMEAGAAAQNLQLQAVAEGLGAVLVGGFHDEATANILGLEAPLAPLMLICVGVPDATSQ